MRDCGKRSNENEKEDGKKEVKREDRKKNNIRRPVTAQKYALKNDYDDVV